MNDKSGSTALTTFHGRKRRRGYFDVDIKDLSYVPQ